jgi:hypothetical protein
VSQVCAEVLVLVCESAPGMARKSQALITHALTLALGLMLSFEEDEGWAFETEVQLPSPQPTPFPPPHVLPSP